MRQLLMSIALLGAVFGASAQEAAGPQACRADAQRLCQGVEPGNGRVAQCLKGKESQVSAECKAHMEKMHEAMQQRMQAFNEACEGDADRHCKGVEPGQGRIAGCLRKNEAALSSACREQLAEMDARRDHARGHMHRLADACKDDARQYCAEVRPGGGRMGRCLKEHEAQLSASCREALQPK